MRGVDRGARRHVYGLGRLPEAPPSGELGALAARPPADGVPVWHTADGRLVTDTYDAGLGRPRPARAAAWAFEPLAWSQHGRAARGRAAARRLLDLRSAWLATGRGERGSPAGYLLQQPDAGTRPLLSALHPVTRDQLVTTDAGEAEALGYVETTVLGHIRAAAPVTGTLGLMRSDVPWAGQFGQGFRPDGGLLLGSLELPAPNAPIPSESLRIAGWAVGIGDRVRRVDVFIGGHPVGRARLALPRDDLTRHPPVAGAADAVLAGFELVPASADIRLSGDAIDVAVLVTTMAGRTLVMESNGVRLVQGKPPLSLESRRGDAAAERVPRRGADRNGSGLLAITHRLTHGGAQRYFVEQVLRLGQAGFDRCTVIAFQDGPWREPLERSGAEVHITSSYPRTGPAEYEGRIDELCTWCAPRDHSAAFVNTLDCFAGVDLAKRLGLPVAWALHESFDLATWWTIGHGWSPEHAYVFDRLLGALAAADATVFAADATRRLFEPYIDPERALTLPYGVELDSLGELARSFDVERERRARGLRADARAVLSLAMFSPRKGQALLAQAFAEVAGEHPDVELVLVGETPGPYPEAIRDWVAAVGLGDRIRLVPATHDAFAWHLLADVFALASDVESLPLSLLEAMALERPVLASRVFGVPELIEEGRHGFMFEANDLGELASALDRVLRMDREELSAVARAGAELVRERHDPDRYAERFAGLLRSLVDRSTVAARS